MLISLELAEPCNFSGTIAISNDSTTVAIMGCFWNIGDLKKLENPTQQAITATLEKLKEFDDKKELCMTQKLKILECLFLHSESVPAPLLAASYTSPATSIIQEQ
jgi:hypothetical protein